MGGNSSKGDALPKLVAMTTPIEGGANSVMGKWFVQACVPTPFEKDVYNATEFYEWKKKEKAEEQKLKVTFNFRKGAAAFLKSGEVGTGKPSEMTQDGVVENRETGAQWKVRPRLWGVPMPVWLPFIILATEPEKYIVVGYPDRSYLWIMTRQWDYPKEDYQVLEDRCINEWGYTKDKIKIIPQRW